ncbi:MAG: GNAT family N-acetyltransferase [Bacteroidia bacterium]
MSYSLVEVHDPQRVRDFLRFPTLLFANEPDYVGVPSAVEMAIFDPKNNKRCQHLKVRRWLVYEEKIAVGRIAAFLHPRPALDEKAGALGFFDCIDSISVAAMLFNAAESYLQELGCELVDGPIQPGENDQFWGLLVQGKGRPSFGMNWHPPYYHDLFKHFGYQPYYEQLTNYLDLSQPLPDRFFKIAAWVCQKPDVSFLHLNKKRLPGFASDLAEVFNHAWTNFENFQPKTQQQILQEWYRFKPFIREDLVWFAYVRNQPAGFMVVLPDLNELLAKQKSGPQWLRNFRLLLASKYHRPSRLKIVAMGVHESYQRFGLESGLIYHAYKQVEKHYPEVTEVELAWVGGFNEKMLAIHKAAGASPFRVHLTLRKYFDAVREVKKFSIQKA